jgi:Uma2 family endonuclease
VKEYWLVDADKKFVEQYFLQNDEFELAEKIQHGTVRCTVLAGLIIPLEAIFDEDKNEESIKGI